MTSLNMTLLCIYQGLYYFLLKKKVSFLGYQRGGEGTQQMIYCNFIGSLALSLSLCLLAENCFHILKVDFSGNGDPLPRLDVLHGNLVPCEVAQSPSTIYVRITPTTRSIMEKGDHFVMKIELKLVL